MKPEVIIIAKNAEQRNVDELGVTVEVIGASYCLGESEPYEWSNFERIWVYKSTRACASPSFSQQRLSFKAAQKRV